MRIKIDEEIIKEYLDIDEKFTNINQFCNYLLAIEKEPNVRPGVKTMLLKKLLSQEDDRNERMNAQKRSFKDNVEWMREHCIIGEFDRPEVSEMKKNAENPKVPTPPPFEPITDFEKIKTIFEQTEYKNIKPFEESEVDYTEGIVLREGGVITQQDHNQIFLYKSGMELDLSKVLIVEAEGNKVLALGYLVQENQTEYTVIFHNKNCIDYDSFKNIRQARFVFYTKTGELYSRSIEIDYKPFDIEKERPLCIDFGTSNTTVGSYGIRNRKADEAEIVQFIDVTVNPNNTKAVLLPTIVYVEDCSDEKNIKYLFGYEARKKIESEHYETKASVYYEIKRWISSANEEEEIRDSNNNRARPLKKGIIKAYIDYVIETAEQYFATRFEKIHFSAPVKLKEQFINVFSEMYKDEKQVLSAEDSIDEGIAIVYNQIITLLYADDKKDGEEKSIMIMDCGGGTTDLASCEYKYRKTGTGVELELNTCFENGNANFGGNNITYRIMQLLKIKIAAMLRSGYIDNEGEVISMIDKSENEILGLIEGHMMGKTYDSDNADNDIYEKFLENYQRAENIIPTQYGNEDNKEKQLYRGTESLKKIKRNFYYLWRQAERIKIEFYRTERVLMDFKDGNEDTIIQIKNPDNYYLYVIDETNPNMLRKESNPFENISITIKEINRVICGDIYSLLVGLFQNGELTSKKMKVDDFNYYKLSGQSCKISLFSELIKEYIPGRKFRPAIENSGGVEKRNSEDLKLDCILGSINYVKDQLRPEMNVILKPGIPEVIYNVYLEGNHNEDKVLFECREPEDIKMEISPENTKEYPLMIISKDNAYERKFIFELRSPEDADEIWTTKSIKNKLNKNSIVSEEAIDTFINKLSSVVRENEKTINIVFAVPAKQGYGIWIGQIQARSTEDGSEYKLLKFDYENFEDSSKTFFDGKR